MTTLPTFDPAPGPLTEPFWSAIEREALALPRCSVCGRWQWYPKPHGTDCVGGELQWEDVAPTGSVYTFTRVHRSFLPDTARNEPFIVGSVELDGINGPKLVANFANDSRLEIGARVRARFDRVGKRLHPVFLVEDD